MNVKQVQIKKAGIQPHICLYAKFCSKKEHVHDCWLVSTCDCSLLFLFLRGVGCVICLSSLNVTMEQLACCASVLLLQTRLAIPSITVTHSHTFGAFPFFSNSKKCSSISELTNCFMSTGWANADRFIATAGSPISDLASFITSFLHTWNWSHSCRVVISVISM